MGERKFIIKEWGLDDPSPGWTITESELKRRIDTIISLRVKDGGAAWSWDLAFEILVSRSGTRIILDSQAAAFFRKLIAERNGGPGAR